MKNLCTLLAIFLAVSSKLTVALAQESEGFISEEQNDDAASAHEEKFAREHTVISRVKRMGELDEELFEDDMEAADSQHYPVSFLVLSNVLYICTFVCTTYKILIVLS